MQLKTYKIGDQEYVIDPDIEQVQLIIQIISKAGVDIDTEKDDDKIIGAKVTQIIAQVMKEGKIGQLLSYLFTPKNSGWSLELAKQHENNLLKVKPREVLGIVSDFFTIITGGSLGTG